MALEKIEFFGSADRKGKHKDGKITSEYPAWYLRQHMEELQHEIDYTSASLSNGTVPNENVNDTKRRLDLLEERMIEIKRSKPTLKGKDIDIANKIYEDTVCQIADSMFSRSEMNKGLVSAHEEARRCSEPIIDVSEHGEAFRQMGINPKGGKVSRNQASRAVKILGRLLDKPTNTEYFRKDYAHGTYRGERSMAEVEAS